MVWLAFRIVAIGEAASFRRPHPMVALAEGEFMIQEEIGDICFNDAEVIHRRDRPNRNNRLIWIGCDWNAINGRKDIG